MNSETTSSQTLLDRLAAIYPTAKRTTLRRMLQERRVRVNGMIQVDAKRAIHVGDTIEVDRDGAKETRRPKQRIALPFTIVHEDDDILVIDKPAGLLTSTNERERRPTALAAVREYVNGADDLPSRRARRVQIGLIHRLDRDAAGLLVFSKNHDAYLSLKRQFAAHTAGRTYLAVVRGTPTPLSGTIESRLVERADGSIRSAREPGEGQLAVTHYETVKRAKGKSLLRVRLETGKKHQIRAHLAERGVPIVNDVLYNSDKPAGALFLVAIELAIDHPRDGRRVTFKIEPPGAMSLET